MNENDDDNGQCKWMEFFISFTKKNAFCLLLFAYNDDGKCR